MTDHPLEPDLRAVTGAFVVAAARFVVIGGFAVVAHRHIRATEDVDLLVPDDSDNDERCLNALRALGAHRLGSDRELAAMDLESRAHLRVASRGGLIDLLREGESPLDFESASADALSADLGDGGFLVAGLATIVALKRLAGRPRDRQDLEALAEEHGPLPMLALPEVAEYEEDPGPR